MPAWRTQKVTSATPTNPFIWGGGPGVFAANDQASGDGFSGQTISLYMAPTETAPDADWVLVGNATSGYAQLTASGATGFNAPRAWFLRVVASGACSVRFAAEPAYEPGFH